MSSCHQFQFPSESVMISCFLHHHDSFPKVDPAIVIPERSDLSFSDALYDVYGVFARAFANQCTSAATVDEISQASGIILGGFIGPALSQSFVEGVILQLGETIKQCAISRPISAQKIEL